MVRQCDNPLSVDVVIPVFNEKPESLAATLSACVNQTYPISTIFVVDDASAEPVSLPSWAVKSPQVCIIHHPENRGISAARNTAIARSSADLLACVNTEVLPDLDWLVTCRTYLSHHVTVGACYTRLVPYWPNRILSRWRMRFEETTFGGTSGNSPFAPGHAVLFRREAMDAVGGYHVRFRRDHEDSDICHRMRTLGWETHYVAQSRCVSIQEDSLKEIATKELRKNGWFSPNESSLFDLYVNMSKWTFIRAGRNILKGRLYFIPVDAAIWAYALWIATARTLRSIQSGH